MSPEDLAELAENPRCVWLDGGGAREWSGRRSLVGWLDEDDVSLTWSAATGVVTRHASGTATPVGTDVFDVLEAELAAGQVGDQWFGWFGYAARPDLPALLEAGHRSDVPDAVWMRPSHLRVSDVAPARPPGPTRGGERPSTAPAHYVDAFARVQEELRAGNSYEVNLTHRLEATSEQDPVATYLRLRALNPAPYAGFVQHDVPGARGWLLSSSPERFALITRDGDARTIETRPIKGTTPRGATPEEDAAQRERLGEPRFRAENLMITDLLRNDLAQVCEVGSVEVPELMRVETYASLHQLVTTVRGRLRADVTTLGALRALFPAGSMTGAPKLRTMQIIEAVEETPRGAYAGAFGWIAADGRADLGVVIRSLTTHDGATYRMGTGGGITVHSELESEWAETEVKAARLREALAGRLPPVDCW